MLNDGASGRIIYSLGCSVLVIIIVMSLGRVGEIQLELQNYVIIIQTVLEIS